jgi:hypothetical protein
MKRFIVLSVIIFSAISVMGAKNGGILILRPDKVGVTQNNDEATRSMADWYDWKRGLSTQTGIIVVPTLYGDSLTVKGFRNNRYDSTICLKLIYENNRSDTDIVCLGAMESSEKLPAIWKFWIVRGSSLDSVSIKRQFYK